MVHGNVDEGFVLARGWATKVQRCCSKEILQRGCNQNE